MAKIACLFDLTVDAFITGRPHSNDRRDFPLWFTADDQTMAALRSIRTPAARAMAVRSIGLAIKAAEEEDKRRLEDPGFAP